MKRNTTLTDTAARKLLGLPARGTFTDQELTAAFSTRAKEFHPDAGGSDASMVQLNTARAVLEPLAVVADAFTGPATTSLANGEPLELVINPLGHLLGPDGLWLGDCGSVKRAEDYCAEAGWKYRISNELPQQSPELKTDQDHSPTTSPPAITDMTTTTTTTTSPQPGEGENLSDDCNRMCETILFEAQRLLGLLPSKNLTELEALNDCAGSIACAAQEMCALMWDDPHMKNSEGVWVPAVDLKANTDFSHEGSCWVPADWVSRADKIAEQLNS